MITVCGWCLVSGQITFLRGFELALGEHLELSLAGLNFQAIVVSRAGQLKSCAVSHGLCARHSHRLRDTLDAAGVSAEKG